LAASFQASFGKVGDAAATGHAQAAKVFAGELEHKAEAGTAHTESMTTLEGSAVAFAGPDAESEKLTAELKTAAAKAEEMTEELQKLNEQATTSGDSANSTKLYYPVMYFVDKDYVDAPSTCGGEAAAKPIVGSFDGCAEACEKSVGKCVGFTYLADKDGLCFLHSSISSATYYTGCGKAEKTKFLQRSAASEPDGTKCVVKFAMFDGTTLKPDPSGKCKECLKEATKADLGADIQKMTAEKGATMKEAMATAQYIKDLHLDCDWLMTNFQARKDARAGEVESLKNAKAVLAGADYSLLSTSAKRNFLRGHVM